MRFKFCGELDCPDWVLAEVQVLSKLTSIKVKLFVSEVVDAIIDKREFNVDKLSNLTSTARIQGDEVRGIAACIAFIVTSAAKFKTPMHALSEELQQLGLPKEHAASLSNIYSQRHDALLSYLDTSYEIFGQLTDIKVVEKKTFLSDGRYSVNIPTVTLKFVIETDIRPQESYICFTREDLDAVIRDLESLKLQSDIYAEVA
jgi:hypothetical protein